jgi:hypothetical protein
MRLSEIKSLPAKVRDPHNHYKVFTVLGRHQDQFVLIEDGSDAARLVYDAYDWDLIIPKKVLHKYLMRSTDSHLPLRPILTFHFESKKDYEYYKNQHSYELISYEGEVEVNDATGV